MERREVVRAFDMMSYILTAPAGENHPSQEGGLFADSAIRIGNESVFRAFFIKNIAIKEKIYKKIKVKKSQFSVVFVGAYWLQRKKVKYF